MNSFAEALKRANIEVEEPKFKPFESDKDVMFPVMLDDVMFYTINQDMLKDANYIRSSMVPLDKDSFEKRVKLFEDSKIKQWVLDNADKCYEVNTGGIRKKEGKYINQNDFEQAYEEDTHYGLCCLGYYIEYKLSARKIFVKFHHSASLVYKAAGIDFSSLGITSDWYSDYTEEDWVKVLDALAKVSEFVPVMIDYDPCVYWNHWKNFRLFGKSDEYSALGINLLEDKEAMEELEDWMVAGGKINPKVWYFLKQGQDGYWYLKRDLQKSPRPEKSKN